MAMFFPKNLKLLRISKGLYTHFKTIEQLKPTESVIGQHSSDFLKLLRNAHRHEVLAPNRYELSLIRAEIDRILG